MGAISAKSVKELRDKTGAGMMACKKALVATDGDNEAAIEYLRKAGILKARKKAGRAASEGRIVSRIENGVGILAEVLCETDFVAKTDEFRNFCTDLSSRLVTEYSGTGDISSTVIEQEKERLTELIALVGENMQIRRVCRWGSDGDLSNYLHMNGSIGVLLDSAGDDDSELLSNVCMHIAAFSPLYVDPDSVPEEVIDKEREIAAEQFQDKPENIIDRIVTGKIKKWYTDVCLVKQPWVRDDKTCLEKVSPEFEARRFLRWAAGEEI